MLDGDGASEKRGPAIRRKHCQRVRIVDGNGDDAVFVLRIGNGVVVDFEKLPPDWKAERLDEQPLGGEE